MEQRYSNTCSPNSEPEAFRLYFQNEDNPAYTAGTILRISQFHSY